MSESQVELTTMSILSAATVFTIQALLYMRITKGMESSSSSSSSSTLLHPRSKESSQSNEISNDDVVTVTLPAWLTKSKSDYSSRPYVSEKDRMSLAIHLSARNVEEGTGGPFGSAIFEKRTYYNEIDTKTGISPPSCSSSSTYHLVSLGVNRVVPLGNSTLHGETVAIQMAQRAVGNYTLKGAENVGCLDGRRRSGSRYNSSYELYTSCEPCAMCLGAALWSGVSLIVCAARKDDASAIGFDEGPVFEESYKHLEEAGITVRRGILRDEAAAVLRSYGKNGLIYNA